MTYNQYCKQVAPFSPTPEQDRGDVRGMEIMNGGHINLTLFR